MASGRAAARDTRHGRRGGGWIEEPRPDPATPPKVQLIKHVCPHCHGSFLGVVAAEHCGTIVCTAMAEWSADRWAGAGRMAAARRAAGLPPGPLDAEAERRAKGRG